MQNHNPHKINQIATMMKVSEAEMPTYKTAQCAACGDVAEYAFGPYGSEEPCINCDAAPVQLIELESYTIWRNAGLL